MEDLQKFCEYIYKCSKDPTFLMLMETYGQEFYDKEKQKIQHTGAIESASAIMTAFLEPKFFIAVLSDQGDLVASKVSFAIEENLLG